MVVIGNKENKMVFTNHNSTKAADRTVSAGKTIINIKIIPFFLMANSGPILPNIYFSLFQIYLFVLLHALFII